MKTHRKWLQTLRMHQRYKHLLNGTWDSFFTPSVSRTIALSNSFYYYGPLLKQVVQTDSKNTLRLTYYSTPRERSECTPFRYTRSQICIKFTLTHKSSTKECHLFQSTYKDLITNHHEIIIWATTKRNCPSSLHRKWIIDNFAFSFNWLNFSSGSSIRPIQKKYFVYL